VRKRDQFSTFPLTVILMSGSIISKKYILWPFQEDDKMPRILRKEERERLKEEARKLAKEGVSKKEIAKRLGVSLATVYRYLQEDNKKSVPSAFLEDVRKFLEQEQVLLKELERCLALDTDTKEKELDKFFHENPWFARFLGAMFTERFDKWITQLDDVERLREIAIKVREDHGWIRDFLHRWILTEFRGFINPPTTCSVLSSIDTGRNYPQIEEKLFSGVKLISHIKWDLDDYLEEILRKLERTEKVLGDMEEFSARLDPGFFENMENILNKIISKGTELLSLLEKMREGR